jgi:hypothetical protein
VTSAIDAPGGFYDVPVSAIDNADAAHAGSDNAVYVVEGPLEVSVASSATTVKAGTTVTLTATVTTEGTPAAGASVVFRIGKPGGGTVTGVGTSDGSGLATFTYRTKKRPMGSHTVFVEGTLGTRVGTATTSFTTVK